MEAVGEVLLQDNFTVWDPKNLIRKGRERHLFLFEMCLVFSKDVKDSGGKAKYAYKFRMMVSCARTHARTHGPENSTACSL